MDAKNHINEEMQAVALDWVQTFVAQRKAALMKGKKGVASGELLRSFEVEATRLAREEGIALAIAFDDAGRLLDMKTKSLNYDKWGETAIHAFEKWILRRGIGGFAADYLRKHPNFGSRKGFNLNRMVRDIAWGIAITRTNGKFRRGKSFWNKAKTAGTYELINQVAGALPAPTLDALKTQFDGKGKG